MAKKKAAPKNDSKPRYDAFEHPEAQSPMRPDVGTQAAFKKKKPPVTYRYDSSLSPALDWDGQNPAREQGEWLIATAMEAARLAPPQEFPEPRVFKDSRERVVASVRGLIDALDQLKRLGKPFLDWAGKAERLSFDVPTLPLFVHERLSTKAIVETLHGHKRDQNTQRTMFDLFGDPHHPIADQLTRAYEYKDGWVNRMILGDSLVAMNSLLHFENLGGQVQMIYMDPPYGIKFGSNFQPFVRKRDVSHGDDEDMTREPEMVQAFRDTWAYGVHSYLTVIRDRLVIARELLHNSGSLFIQISDENVHYLRSILDDVFGEENFQAQINFKSMQALGQSGLAKVYDYILWYSKDKERAKFRPLFAPKDIEDDREYRFVDDATTDLGYRRIKEEEFRSLNDYSTVFRRSALTSSGYTVTCTFPFELQGIVCKPFGRKSWRTNRSGIDSLIEKNRLFVLSSNAYFKLYYNDFPYMALENSWTEQAAAGERLYVVQTGDKFIQRCMLMTTDPGDLVLDPTCGSGTTAYVAEQWGRRWITIDTSRVPLALARQRLLTATFSYYQLADEKRGPAGGFVYKRKQNNRGEEVGGIVPHVTLGSIANNEPPTEEVLVDRPEVESGVTRVSGPFTVEGTIPPPVEMGEIGPRIDAEERGSGEEAKLSRIDPRSSVSIRGDDRFSDRMLEVLRKSPVLRLEGNRTVNLKNVRPPAKALTLSAEAIQTGDEDQAVAFVFGPENGAVTETLVHQALREANMKGYVHLYVVGFAIQPNARGLIDQAAAMGVPATYVQATPDLMMGDLLKSLRSSQIFSVCGLPEVRIIGPRIDADERGSGKKGFPENLKSVQPDSGSYPRSSSSISGTNFFQVELVGLDVFDPVTMEVEHRKGDDVPAWFLDTDYNNLCFHVCQAFFPRTSAWDSLKKALKGTHDDAVWEHLAGTTSAPFEPGEHRQIAVKVIDDRGNELLVVKRLEAADDRG